MDRGDFAYVDDPQAQSTSCRGKVFQWLFRLVMSGRMRRLSRTDFHRWQA